MKVIETTRVTHLQTVYSGGDKCNSMHIMVTRVGLGHDLDARSKRLARQGFEENRPYLPPSSSLAMVANCMLDVPS